MDPAHSSTNSARLAPFLRTLADTGEVTVARLAKPTDLLEDAGADEILRELDDAARAELSGDAPPPDPAAARWAARRLYRAAQALVCRDLPAEALPAVFGDACPSPAGPGSAWAVDLVFRHLPELHAIAHRVAPADALGAFLGAWAREWPLSSVGITLAAPPELSAFAGHPVLWRLYLDRIAARGAADRLGDPRVRAALTTDFGAHPALAPALFSALQRAGPPPPPAPSASVPPPAPVSP